MKMIVEMCSNRKCTVGDGRYIKEIDATEDQKRKRKENGFCWDVAIVGAGVGGTYQALEFMQYKKELNVIVIEQESTVGGQVTSDCGSTVHGDEVCLELGPMRLFPPHMCKVFQLFSRLNLTVQALPSNSKYMFVRDQIWQGTQKRYNVNGEHVRSVGELTAAASAAYRKDSGDNSEAFVKADAHPGLNEYSVMRYLRERVNVTEEEIKFFRASGGGYDTWQEDDVSVVPWLVDSPIYSGLAGDHQWFTSGGLQKFPDAMFRASNKWAKYMMDTRVDRFFKTLNPNISSEVFTLETYNTVQTDPKIDICAKQLIISHPHSGLLRSIANVTSPQRYKAITQAVKAFPLLKIFFRFPTHNCEKDGETVRYGWWCNYGLYGGKMVTDMDVRQIHYYDAEHLLVYVSHDIATKLHKQLTDHDDAGRMHTLHRLWKQIVKAHDHDWKGTDAQGKTNNGHAIPKPIWSQTVIKYWYASSPKWRIGWNRTATMELIENGGRKNNGDGSDLYVCSDQFSRWPAWMQGSMNRMDACRFWMDAPKTEQGKTQKHEVPDFDGECEEPAYPNVTESLSANEAEVQADVRVDLN
jgi:hypothetical protein